MYCELLRASWQGTVGSVRRGDSHRRSPKLQTWRPWCCACWQTAILHGVTSQQIVISIRTPARTWNSNLKADRIQEIFLKSHILFTVPLVSLFSRTAYFIQLKWINDIMHWMTKIRFPTGVGFFFFFAVASKPGFIPITGYQGGGGKTAGACLSTQCRDQCMELRVLKALCLK